MPADERPAAVDHLHEVDVGRRVIDLADVERPRRVDVSRPRLEPLEMLRIGGPFFRDLLWAEQCGDAAGDREIGRSRQAGLLASSADLGDDGSERWSLQHEPLLSQRLHDDLLDTLVKALFPSPVPVAQQRRHGPVDAVARQQIVDLAGRQAQLRGGPLD